MKDVTKDAQYMTEEEIFVSLKEILYEVAPLKIVDEVTLDSSLVEDYAFDSIDMMTMLLNIQNRFLKENPMLDLDRFLNETFSRGDGKPVTVRTVCQLIAEHIHV